MIKLSTQIRRALDIISKDDPCDQTRRSAEYVLKIMDDENIDYVFDIPAPDSFLVRAYVESGVKVWHINQNYGDHYRIIGQAVYNEVFNPDKPDVPYAVSFRQIRMETIYERLISHESNIKYAIKNNPLEYQLGFIFNYKKVLDIRGEILIPYSENNITYSREEDEEGNETKIWHAYSLGEATKYFQEKLFSYFEQYETDLKNKLDKYIENRDEYADFLTRIYRSGICEDITKNFVRT